MSSKKDYTFNKNMKAIQKYKPQILAYVKREPDVDMMPLYDERYSAEILKQEYEKHHLLIDQCTTGVIFCVEPNILHQLLIKYPTYRHFFAIFPSATYFNQMLQNYDLTEAIKDPKFLPLFGENEAILERNIMHNCEKVDIMHNGVRIFGYQPFDKINKKLLEMVVNVLSRIAMGIHVNLNTSIIYGENIFRNDIRSIDKQIKYPTIEYLRDVAKDKPIICVAAGPSLTHHLERLKEIQHEVFIVSVVAAIKPLRAAGIEADIYTVIDMDDIIEKYFMDVDLKDTKIAIEMSCYHGIMENHPEADYIVSQSSAGGKTYLDEVLTWLGVRTPKESRIHGAMTVAMMSIQVANLMGASQVILLGQDLAYNNVESHVPGSDHSSKVQRIINNDTKQEFLFFEDYGGKKNVALPIEWLPGVKGENVPTTTQFKAYRDFMSQFFKTTGLHPINCTNDGLLIPGCEHMAFDDAYDKYIKPNLVADKTMDVPRCRDKIDITDGIQKIEEMLKEFRAVNQLCLDGQAEFAKPKPDYDIINAYLKTILEEKTKISNYISQNNLPGYYLYRYLDLANCNGDKIKDAINRRNRGRLLFGTVSKGLMMFINEYELMLSKIKELYC